MERKSKFLRNEGFTLIELLIVVAIIAILAAIAVPNFLEAQTRAKVSRAYNDLRCTATGLEAYYVDHNKYPPNPAASSNGPWFIVIPWNLTSPINYASKACLLDVFQQQDGPPNPALAFDTDPDANRRILYQNTQFFKDLLARLPGGLVLSSDGLAITPLGYDLQGGWYIASVGPDRTFGPYVANRFTSGQRTYVIYDPTNGTLSQGDLIRTQKDPLGKGIVPVGAQ